MILEKNNLQTVQAKSELILTSSWVLLQAMFMSDWKQTAHQLKLQKRLLTINKRKTIRWNIYKDNNFHSRRRVLKCLWKSLFMFYAGFRCFLFSKMNSRQENRWKLSFTARIITKYSWNVFFLFAVKKCLKAFKVL